jgi:hypothetical protein
MEASRHVSPGGNREAPLDLRGLSVDCVPLYMTVSIRHGIEDCFCSQKNLKIWSEARCGVAILSSCAQLKSRFLEENDIWSHEIVVGQTPLLCHYIEILPER